MDSAIFIYFFYFNFQLVVAGEQKEIEICAFLWVGLLEKSRHPGFVMHLAQMALESCPLASERCSLS